MQSKTSTWFETKVRIKRTQEDGQQKFVMESYGVEAVSWTEAEARIAKELQNDSGGFEIKDIKKAPYTEVLFSDDTSDDKWYRCKLQLITIDENTEKEKRTGVTYLVNASTLEKARKHIDEEMGRTMINYVITSVTETKLLEVFVYDK